MHVSMEFFGKCGSKDIILFTFTSIKGCVLQVMNYGATLHSWQTHDKAGRLDDVLLGCKDADGYLGDHPYFGCIVGRVANRIGYGRFSLDGKAYNLDCNLGNHHLHGGPVGWHRQFFEHDLYPQSDSVTIIFKGVSLDGDQGYPGKVEYMICYTYTDENEIIMEYRAVVDAATPINMTNHAYFNLDGSATILDHQVGIKSTQITKCDENIISTGEIVSILDTVLDLSSAKTLRHSQDLSDAWITNTKGFDHNYVLDQHTENEVIATAYSPLSGRMLEVSTSEPAIQLYTGNWLGGVEGKSGTYQDYAGFCLETQHFPDAVNHAHFPTTIVRPDELYYTKTVYKISIL